MNPATHPCGGNPRDTAETSPVTGASKCVRTGVDAASGVVKGIFSKLSRESCFSRNGGLVYVFGRGGDGIQVFTKQGKCVKEFPVANDSDNNSAGTINFSPDPQQKYLYVADIMNSVVWILNRDDGDVAGRMRHAGHLPGQFHSLQVATADSQGDIYTGEVTTGERILKFVPAK